MLFWFVEKESETGWRSDSYIEASIDEVSSWNDEPTSLFIGFMKLEDATRLSAVCSKTLVTAGGIENSQKLSPMLRYNPGR